MQQPVKDMDEEAVFEMLKVPLQECGYEKKTWNYTGSDFHGIHRDALEQIVCRIQDNIAPRDVLRIAVEIRNIIKKHDADVAILQKRARQQAYVPSRDAAKALDDAPVEFDLSFIPPEFILGDVAKEVELLGKCCLTRADVAPEQPARCMIEVAMRLLPDNIFLQQVRVKASRARADTVIFREGQKRGVVELKGQCNRFGRELEEAFAQASLYAAWEPVPKACSVPVAVLTSSGCDPHDIVFRIFVGNVIFGQMGDIQKVQAEKGESFGLLLDTKGVLVYNPDLFKSFLSRLVFVGHGIIPIEEENGAMAE